MRLAASLLLLIAATTAVLMLPITRRVTAPAVLNPAKSHPLYAMAAGEIEYAVPAGAWVEADDIVLRLKNPDRELALAVQRGAVREQELRLKQLHTLRAAMPSAARLIPTAAAELADARAQLAELQAMARLLVVRAPAAGRVLPPPERILRRGADELHPWQGSPLEARNLGAWVEMGTPLAVIAEPGGWTAWAGVPQADVGDVEAGQRVRLSIGSHGSEVLAGRVAHVARRARANRDEQSGVSQQSAPLGDRWYHVVEVNLDAADAPLLPGAYGTVKIEAHRDTLGGVLRHEFGRVFRRAF